jgi:hypothetical protein
MMMMMITMEVFSTVASFCVRNTNLITHAELDTEVSRAYAERDTPLGIQNTRAAHKWAIVGTGFFPNRWSGGHATTCTRVEVTLKASCSKSTKLCCILKDNIFYNFVDPMFELIIVVL